MPDQVPITQQTADLLKATLKLDDFYPQLTVDKLKELFPRSGLYAFQPNEKVIQQGSASRNIYIIESGRVRVTRSDGGAVRELAVLTDGAMIGEIAVLQPDGVRTASVSTITPCTIFYLVAEDVRRVMSASAALGEHLRALARTRLDGQGRS